MCTIVIHLSMLSPEDVSQFHRNGFLIIRNLFAGRELQLLREAAERVKDEGASGKGHDHWSREIEGQTVYFRSERLWSRDDIFQAAAVKPELLGCIGQLFGQPFLPMNDSMVCKLPGGRVPVEWHQDPPYQGQNGWESTFGVPNFDVDIYLDETTEENGCVWVIPGHHLVGKVDISRFTEEALYRDHGAVPLCMRPGDVGLHALSVPHVSMGNASNKLRRILFFHYVTREVYDACYSGWMNHNGGYSSEGLAFVRGMLDKRSALGFDGIDERFVVWTENGFEFTGSPGTPPNHWRELIARMPPEEVEMKRRLTWFPSTAARTARSQRSTLQ